MVLKDIGKLVMPIIRGLLGAVGPLLAGAGLAIAGIATLLSGLKDSGPYKGLKKLIGRGLLGSGTALIKKEFGKLSKLALDAAKSLTKGGFVRNFVAATTKGFRNIFRTLKSIPEKIFKTVSGALKNLFSGGAMKEAGTLAKSGGKSLFGRLAGTVGKFLSEKVLKRLPFIGTLIGLGFAFTRLMKGDVIGALLDVASALATSVPVVGTALSIAIDVFSAVRDTQTGGSEKAGKANMNWIEGIKKWIGDRIKYVPVIGPLIDMVHAFGEGKYLDALGYLAKAAIPPLGILIDLFDNKEAVGNAVSSAAKATGNFISDIGTWLYNKAKELPLIGPLIKAGEAIMNGKWEDVLGYLGEAIEPLQYIGKLITGGVESVATAAVTGDFSSIKGFFATIKDSLISAVLNLLPESILGVSVRARVADLLGVKGFGSPKDDTKAANAPSSTANNQSNDQNIAKPEAKKKESHWYNPLSWGSSDKKDNNTPAPAQSTDNTQTPTTTPIQPTDNTQTPTTAPIQPTEASAVPKNTNNQSDKTAGSMGNMNDSLSEHSNLLKGLIEYERQTASNTRELIQVLAKVQGGNGGVSVNNVSNSTNIVSSQVSSSAFRQAVLQR